MKTKTLYKLYLDETGVIGATPPSYFPYFILSGAVVNIFQSDFLKIRADQIKFKYWGRFDVIFHSKEIGRRENEFSILKDPLVEKNFHTDLVNFLDSNQVKLIIVAVDKSEAFKIGWNNKDVYKNSANKILEIFVKFLYQKKSRGQIFLESTDAGKDNMFLNIYNHYLTNGIQQPQITPSEIKNILTSISFVSKKNFDIETQIADLLAYPAGYQCMCEKGIKSIVPNSYEDKMCKSLSGKLIKINGESSFIKLP